MGLSRRALIVGATAAAGGLLAACRGASGPVLPVLPVPAGSGSRPGYVLAAYHAGDPFTGDGSPLWRVLDPVTGGYTAIPGQVAACSPDLRLVLTYGLGSWTRVHDTGTGRAVHDFGVGRLVPLGWSPDGRHIVLAEAVFHDVHSFEDNYETLDRVRVYDVTDGTSREVAGWSPLPTGFVYERHWTGDGRLAVADRLIHMDGTWQQLAISVERLVPLLGTDRYAEMRGDGEGDQALPRPFAEVGRVTDIVRGTATRDPRRIDNLRLRMSELGTTEGRFHSWRDEHRVLIVLPREMFLFDLRDRSEHVVARFPGPTYEIRLGAAAAASPAVPAF
jgi:hypothetical protein